MTEHLDMRQHLSIDVGGVKNRDISHLQGDLACIKAIAQAAVNVELFTIPIYMTALYSVQGMHEINSKDSTLYTGRKWPGAAAAAGDKLTVNEQVFNKVYSVFIEEMLHLQLASNMASTLGFTPVFTSPALQDENYGWKCYAPGTTLIPHILDFKDWKDKDLKDTTVELRAMNKQQAELFMAIEETVEDAKENLTNPDVSVGGDKTRPKYFEPAPFDWFTKDMTETDLPMFGSIGHMYLCYWTYLEIVYSDGTSMLERLTAVQRDQFNADPPQVQAQYPGISGTLVDLDALRIRLINNIDAITDQGEGQGAVSEILGLWRQEPWVLKFEQQQEANKANTAPGMLGAVRKKYQPDAKALEADYPGYNDEGQQTEISGRAQARIDAASADHFEIFEEVLNLVQQKDYETWVEWHQRMGQNPWKPEMLGKDGPRKNLPSTKDIADALNRLNLKENRDETHTTLSQAAVGTIKGITTVLDKYWSSPGGEFPEPAMVGSGDRISICWAVTGMAPDLVTGIKPLSQNELYHACQGMALHGKDSDSCADVRVYHSCKGSNSCKAQGGCGFVQSASGGGSCGGTAAKGLKSAPADNLCGGFGGCAVPISASQLFPKLDGDDCYEMQLYSFGDGPDFKADKIGTMAYEPGEAVYDVAWKAYSKAKAGDPDAKAPELPKPSDIRLAMPPST